MLTTIIRLIQAALTPSFHMPTPLCVYFHYESSLKNVRMPDSGAAIYVDGTEQHVKTLDKKTALLQVLELPQLPLHNTMPPSLAQGCRRVFVM